MELVNALMIGLAGGAIGTLLVWTGRLLLIPAEVREHDRAVRVHDADLEQWVADEHLRLKREVAELVDALAARGALHSGATGVGIGRAKELALHAYRDQERGALRVVESIRDRERWPHVLYRRVSRQPFPMLCAPNAVQPVLDVWRAPVTRHLREMDTPSALEDPTRRTLEDAIRNARANPSALT
jgi:hypothetical protein